MIQDPLLDAVNSCLAGIGQQPVDSVDDPDLDAAMAAQVIERTSREVQSRGWWFNKEDNWEIPVDATTGFMSPPINAIAIIQNSDKRYHQFTIRGNRVYDVDNHTYDLRTAAGESGVIKFSFIIYLPFDELPPTAQWCIGAMSKRMFAQDMEVDQARWQFQTKDEERALAALYREDGRNAKRNYIRDSPAIQAAGIFGTNYYNKPF